jgi:hypothetical protein
MNQPVYASSGVSFSEILKVVLAGVRRAQCAWSLWSPYPLLEQTFNTATDMDESKDGVRLNLGRPKTVAEVAKKICEIKFLADNPIFPYLDITNEIM